MKHFRLYFWKEWREQRPAVLALVALLPLLVLAISLGARGRYVGSPFFILANALLALVVTLIAIGGELLGREDRSEARWLERLPAGLGGAFPSRLALFTLSSLGALVYGGLLGTLGALLRGKTLSSLEFPVPGLEALLLAAALVALWTFWASAWCRRGMLALVAGGILGVLVTSPVWLLVRAGYTPAAWEVRGALFTLAVAPLVAAWRASLGRARGRGSLGALRSTGAGALCLIPLWGWGLWQWSDAGRIDLAAPDCRIDDAWVFENGRSALLEVHMESEHWTDPPHFVLRLDLEDETYRFLGSPNAALLFTWKQDARFPFSDPERILIAASEDDMKQVLIDDASGELVEEDSLDLAEMRFCRPQGHGWSYWDTETGSWVLVDPAHGEFLAEEIGLDSWAEFFIGPQVWWIRDFPDWFEFDPETWELAPIGVTLPVFTTGPMLADGRMLVVLGDLSYALLGPHGGLDPVSAPSKWTRMSREYAFGPNEPVLVDIEDQRYLLDEECLELRLADASYAGDVVRSLPDGTLFFVTEEGIVRRDPDGVRTLRFSFEEARKSEREVQP